MIKEEKIVGQCKSSASKELEALERGIIEFEKNLEDDPNNEWLKRTIAGMKKCYQRLEAIENAEPSEAFECLRQIGVIETYHRDDGTLLKDSIMFKPEYDTIKYSLIKAQEDEEENKRLWNDITTISKQYTDLMLEYQEQKRVLEIIFEKQVDVCELKICIDVYEDSLYQYNKRTIERFRLTQEEFELLKEYFK